MTTTLKYVSAFFIATCLVGFSDGGSRNMTYSQPKISVKLEKNKEYRFSSDGCTSRDNTVCISQADYKAMCMAAKGGTVLATAGLGLHYPRAGYLARNGNIDSIEVTWRDGYKYGCKMEMRVSGIYQGSSARETASGGVTTFIVTNDQDILVHHASPAHY